MFENFIFDYGNVLIDYNFDDMLKPYFDENEDYDKLSVILFDRIYWDALDSGEITESDVCKLIKDRVPEGIYDNCCKVLNNWYCHTPAKQEMWKLVSDLKHSGKGIYLLSNISKTFAEKYSEVKELAALFKNFDGCVFSATAGLVKPQKEIFELILNKYDLNAKNTLFIDDNENNINAAKELGINTFLFKDNTEELKKLIFK